jgi:alpha-L-fucosidase 2
MLLQSQGGVIRVFAAVPDSWMEASFSTLRAEGAFLVSASRRSGMLDSVTVISEKGGKLKLVNGFGREGCRVVGANLSQEKLREAVIEVDTRPEQRLLFVRGG